MSAHTTPLHRRQILSLLLYGALIIAATVLSLEDHFARKLNGDATATWVVCAVVFGIADWLAGPLKSGLWTGYLLVTSIATWLIFGPVAGLLLVLITSFVAALLLVLFMTHNMGDLWRAVERSVVSGVPLVVMMVTYDLVGGQLPVTEQSILAIQLGFVIVLGFIIAQIIGVVITGANPRRSLIWMPGQRQRLISELLLLLISVPLALIYDDVSPMVFNLMLVLIAAQAIRHKQFIQSQADLTSRVRELSLLNGVGQYIVSHLDMEEMVNGVARWSRTVDTALFLLALYDDDLEIVKFPLVIEDGTRQTWPDMRLLNVPEIARIINRGDIVEEFVPYNELVPTSKRVDVVHSIGLPLSVGDKRLGAMLMVQQDGVILNAHVLETASNQIALALRNAILYERSIDVSAKLKQINNSIQDVMFNLNQYDAKNTICETARDLLNADAAALFLLRDHDNRECTLEYVVGDAVSFETLAAFTTDIRTIDPVIINDVSQSADLDHAPSDLISFMRSSAFSAMVEVTLKSGTIPIGKLVVFHLDPHTYPATDVEILDTLAYQVASALDNAELLNALEVYASEQSQLVHLSRMSTSSLDSAEIASSMAQLLQDMIASSWVAVGLRPLETNYLQLYRSDDSQKRLALVLDDLPEIQIVDVEDRLPQIFHIDGLTSASMREWMEDQGIKQLVVSMLVGNNNYLGSVFVADKIGDYIYSDSELRLLEMASNQIAMQIHNAQLYQHTQSALDLRLHQLGLIETIAQEISSALSIDQLIHNVLEAAIRATLADQATIGLVLDNNEMRLIALEKRDDQWIEFESRHGAESGLMGEVIRTGQTLIVDNNALHPDYLEYPSDDSVFQSSLVVPLLQDGKTVGAINIESVELAHFDITHADFASSLAGHAAMSLQNAQLLADRQRQIATLTRLRELALQLAGVTDLEVVMVSVLHCALDMFQGQSAAFFSVTDQHPVVWRSTVGLHVDQMLPVPEKLIQEAAQTDRILFIEDVQANAAYEEMVVTYKSVVFIPIRQQEGFTNVLVTTFPAHHNYRLQNNEIASLLAIQATTHLQNTLLYRRIRMQNDRMRAIMDSTRDGIILLDRHGHLIEANPSAETLLNLTLSQFIGKHFVSSVHHALQEQADTQRLESLQNMFQQVRLEANRIIVNTYEIREGDQVLYVKQIEAPVMDADGQIVGRLLTLRDLSEERQLAIYRDEISNMVVHDLRGPLGSIVSSLILIQEELAESPHDGTLDTLIQVSLDSANRLLDLVNSLLEIAKLETRRLPLQKQRISLYKIVDEAIATLAMTLNRANITMTLEVDNLPEVLVDNGKIRRVFINLIDNAIRYTPNDGQIIIRAEKVAGDKLRVLVADSGPGIPADEAGQVFDKFRQVNTILPGRSGVKGTGLGLTFCKLAIEAHDEQIWLATESPLSGACFMFTLPLAT